MIDTELSRHVRDALQSGRSPAQIRAALDAAGWTGQEIDAALSRWMPGAETGPVPRPIRSTAARDALLFALLFVVFGMVGGNALTLLLGQVDLWMPEPGETGGARRLASMRWSMAAIIVFVPVFWWLDRTDARALRADPSRWHATVRRWLAAIAMLLAVITLLGGALTLIYSWLDGQITRRFLVKSAVVAMMALIVLAYFREERGKVRLAAHGLIAVALVALGLSFWTVGGPLQGQMEQRDRWRVQDLRILAGDVASCLSGDAALPQDLDPMSCARNPIRLTGYADAIVYQRLAAGRYQLCTQVEFPAVVTQPNLHVSGNSACLRHERN